MKVQGGHVQQEAAAGTKTLRWGPTGWGGTDVVGVEWTRESVGDCGVEGRQGGPVGLRGHVEELGFVFREDGRVGQGKCHDYILQVSLWLPGKK